MAFCFFNNWRKRFLKLKFPFFLNIKLEMINDYLKGQVAFALRIEGVEKTVGVTGTICCHHKKKKRDKL